MLSRKEIETAVLVQIRRVILEHYPTAVGMTFEGEYGDDGLDVNLSGVQLTNGTVEPGNDGWDEMDDSMHEYTTWLETTVGDEYENTTTISFTETPSVQNEPTAHPSL